MKRIAWQFPLTALLLCLTLVASSVSGRRRSEYLAQPLENIGTQMAGWHATAEQTLGARVLKSLLPTSYLSRTYQKDDRTLGLFIAFYAQQRAGESMHSPKACLPGSGWEIWNYGAADVPVNGQPVKVNKYFIHNAGDRLLMFYWYQSRQRIISSEYLGKLLLVRDALVDGRTAGSLVRITVPDVAGASDEAVKFASVLIPQVQRCFGQ